MIVRVTQLDGKLPNLALMRLSAWHKHNGDVVCWERGINRQFHEPRYEAVYGSAIFSTTAKKARLFKDQFPDAIIGGSGGDPELRVESIVPSQFVGLDYAGYQDFVASIGYAMRGCRFKCGFCVVPKQEGAPRSASTVDQVWRGAPFPRHLHLLDNDFFGNPEWRNAVDEIRRGDFKVCINQGINVRLIDDEQAQAMASMRVTDDQFKTRRIYTAWDNIGDEKPFVDGVARLIAAGIKPDAIMVYMLVGYDRRETWERIWHRYHKMMEIGVRPYPMVFGGDEKTQRSCEYHKLKLFQRWVITGVHKIAPFDEFNRSHKASKPSGGLLDIMTGDEDGRDETQPEA